MATTDPIRDLDQLHQLANYFLDKGKPRNYVMVVLASSTTLRISDLLRLEWKHVYDEANDCFYTHIGTIEQKTGKSKIIALSKKVIEALRLLYPHRRSAFIFARERGVAYPISRVQSWRLITTAAKELGLEGVISCHSLRKTFGYHCARNNVPPVIIMSIYNHKDFETTKRYLGITQDEIDKAYIDTELF